MGFLVLGVCNLYFSADPTEGVAGWKCHAWIQAIVIVDHVIENSVFETEAELGRSTTTMEFLCLITKLVAHNFNKSSSEKSARVLNCIQ